MAADAYAEMAEAVLFYDWAKRSGNDHDRIQAHRRLVWLAALLVEAGWSIGKEK